ncbi:hypothetical protein D6S19_23280 [Salmonella enterica subsp. enterica serovar Reading]|nr:hypothetical protein [Salmonella enterica subsp. enterica serovar Reading]ECB6686788.1 hypothetical protein [Salmonella enterica subsp. enterica serovar Poona]ECC9217265.1 hypothetical protein [Salmonella enterica subsp. enterica]EEH6203206.1 hypothetical protein [Salmonella enterica]EDV9778421.1 hypothetical protein [Salmonella enterica subsp. enterica serovar Poona]
MTLATYASRFIQEMERRYGERDRRWTYVGVAFHDDVPQLWFPGSWEIPPRMHIAISLGRLAFSRRENAVCQQVVGGGAPVIEEGLVTVFSEDMLEFWCNYPDKQAFTQDPRYMSAAASVRQLLVLEPDAIRQLRRIEPAFEHMTAETFSRAGLNVPMPLVATLLAVFPAKNV